MAVMFSSSSNEFSGREKSIISTLLNWCWRMSPRMSLP